MQCAYSHYQVSSCIPTLKITLSLKTVLLVLVLVIFSFCLIFNTVHLCAMKMRHNLYRKNTFTVEIKAVEGENTRSLMAAKNCICWVSLSFDVVVAPRDRFVFLIFEETTVRRIYFGSRQKCNRELISVVSCCSVMNTSLFRTTLLPWILYNNQGNIKEGFI